MSNNITWLQHPMHGVKPCYTPGEVAMDKANGWTELDLRTKEARTLHLRKPNGDSNRDNHPITPLS